MTTRFRHIGLLAALPILVAGCASANAGSPPAANSRPVPTGSTSTSTSTTPPPGAVQQVFAPSTSATMVCGSEIQGSVSTILGLPTPPRTTSTWIDQLYTCTYHLSDGPLAVSVKESGNVASARIYFDALRQHSGSSQPLRGLDSLGLPAFETPNGTVTFLKDDKTLQVDATGLPPEVNAQHRQRTDLAYTLATDILGCWNGK